MQSKKIFVTPQISYPCKFDLIPKRREKKGGVFELFLSKCTSQRKGWAWYRYQ